MRLKVIAYAHNGHTDKFGIPRQSREESPILTRIVFEPEYSVREALRGIEGFSHLWLIWGFDKRPTSGPSLEGGELNWSPTVRPPRLGGNKRMGVFATRSPFRPNPIGISSVRLIKAYPRPLPEGKGERWELLVSGADVLDGTPIYDIKPYLSYSDSHPEATNGFAEETKDYRVTCDWSRVDGKWPSEEWKRDVEYILSQDPKPAYQDDPVREYKMDYGGWCVVFSVNSNARVIYIHSIYIKCG